MRTHPFCRRFQILTSESTFPNPPDLVTKIVGRPPTSIVPTATPDSSSPISVTVRTPRLRNVASAVSPPTMATAPTCSRWIKVAAAQANSRATSSSGQPSAMCQSSHDPRRTDASRPHAGTPRRQLVLLHPIQLQKQTRCTDAKNRKR